jgi:hypothetical protein
MYSKLSSLLVSSSQGLRVIQGAIGRNISKLESLLYKAAAAHPSFKLNPFNRGINASFL